jgi:hypothetical protein
MRLRAIIALLATLGVIYFIPNRLLTLGILLLVWWAVFSPIARREWALFAIAGAFFLVQNYLALRAGIFEFRFKDIMLMPYYEPFLWGFYFLFLKRLVNDPDVPRVELKAVIGVVATSIAFSLSVESRTLLIASACSTALVLAMFHTRDDLHYASAALALGFIIELFGVRTGLWWYPAPDFLGMPYWFATMWITAGLLGRRFVVPAANWLAEMGVQRAYRPGARMP